MYLTVSICLKIKIKLQNNKNITVLINILLKTEIIFITKLLIILHKICNIITYVINVGGSNTSVPKFVYLYRYSRISKFHKNLKLKILIKSSKTYMLKSACFIGACTTY